MPSLRNVYFLTDGPTTQYRNKKMFYLLAKFLGKRLEAETIQLQLSESGHGKGAPDGISGCIKRRLDSLVATGSDTYSQFRGCMYETTDRQRNKSIPCGGKCNFRY